jgi:hypothetical protein
MEKEWEIPKDIFEAQNLKNRVINNNFKDIFERENAKNWLIEHGFKINDIK